MECLYIMSDPVEKLKQAKNLLEQGLITQEIFDDIQQKVLAEMGMGSKKTSNTEPEESPEDLFASTQVELSSSRDEESNEDLFGSTQV